MGEAGVRDSSNKFSCSLKNMTLTLSNGNTYLGSTSKGLCTNHIERNVKTFIIILSATFWSFCPMYVICRQLQRLCCHMAMGQSCMDPMWSTRDNGREVLSMDLALCIIKGQSNQNILDNLKGNVSWKLWWMYGTFTVFKSNKMWGKGVVYKKNGEVLVSGTVKNNKVYKRKKKIWNILQIFLNMNKQMYFLMQ